MNCTLDILTKLSSSLLTPVLAIIGAWILINQYRLQRLRWKLDLYDKRYPVFISTMKYIAYIVQHANVNDEVLFTFLRDSKDKEFLFGRDVKTHLQSLYNRGLDLQVLKIKLESEPVGDERNQMVERSSTLVHWFSEQFEVSKNLFGQYLAIDQK